MFLPATTSGCRLQHVRPRTNTSLLPVAPSSFHSARGSVRFGCSAKTMAASAALTSVGVRGTRLRTSTAHDLARSVVRSPHVAVPSRRLIVALFGSPTLSSAISSRRASESLVAIEGAAQCAPPSCRSGAAAAEYGYRYCLLLAWAAQTADPLSSQRRERGTGGTEAGPSAIRASVRRPTRPNPSFKPSPNGGPPGPVWRYAVHFRQPGPGVPPSGPA